MASLDISVDQVVFIINMARDLEDALPRDGDNSDDESHRGEAVDPELVNEHEYDPAYQELLGFLETLTEDELAALVALMWIGRGTYEAEELQTALDEARSTGAAQNPNYLLSVPLLAEYLEEGLNMLGLQGEET